MLMTVIKDKHDPYHDYLNEGLVMMQILPFEDDGHLDTNRRVIFLHKLKASEL